jgi:hypothetical protein
MNFIKKLSIILFFPICNFAFADEGFWLLNDPPTDLIKQKYNFQLTPEWLEHAQKSAVRFNSGGSGSFVSPEGLTITNHHVGAECLEKLSPPGKDYYRDGYLANTRDAELKCPDLELNVLISIEDVTARVNAAVTSEMTPQIASQARQKKMAEIEKESLDQTGLRSDIITLFRGGLYHLYRYKKYTDVRLVFSPEVAVASFGGEVDNFEFPRFNFDIAFFRAYENDKEVHSNYFLKFNTSSPAENDLVFLLGNPGSTNRLDTIDALKFRRDVHLPYFLNRMHSLEVLLQQFADQGKVERTMVGEKLHDAANSRKSAAGQYQGLLDRSMIQIKEQNEKEFRTEVEKDPELKDAIQAWDQIKQSVEARKKFYVEYMLLEKGDAFESKLFDIARHLTRMETELQKPGPERLREYRESNLESLKQEIYSPAPIAAKLEQAQLAGSLAFLSENLGGDHPIVREILEGRSPETRAMELVAGTKLMDHNVRMKISDVKTSNDQMIQLALKIDDYCRKLRSKYESEVEEVERQAYGKIEIARFRKLGKTKYPDGTFSLRLSFGSLKTYREFDSEVPIATTFAGAFRRAEEHDNVDPFARPESWIKNKQNINLNVPLNFISDADTYGGNSGSPVLNRKGEFIGINFDRNRYGLTRNFIYTKEQARQISVHAAAIMEALHHIYKAQNLIEELNLIQ